MTLARPDHISYLDTLPRFPAWVTAARAETYEDVAFLSGAALNHLHLVLRREEAPKPCCGTGSRCALPRLVWRSPGDRSGRGSCAMRCTFFAPATCQGRRVGLTLLGGARGSGQCRSRFWVEAWRPSSRARSSRGLMRGRAVRSTVLRWCWRPC